MVIHSNTIHPFWLRLTHWINVIAVVILVMSGWRIYNASPIFGDFKFPVSITLGGWLGGALQWHFAAMWLLFINGVLYLLFNIMTKRFALKFFPLRPSELLHDFSAALKGKLAHDDSRQYNALQKLAYIFVIADLIIIVLSGLAVWKPVQFPLLRELMLGFDNARVVHFIAMAALMVFFMVHLLMVAIVPRTLLAMLRGR
jgi:thiosulfate reductase cytochrome b subunit